MVSPGATGNATTVHETELLGDVVHPVPVAVLLLSIVFVPTIAANEGTVVDHALHVVPPLVLYLYSSAIVPVPPLPAVIVTVSVCPEHTFATFGDLVSPGATGRAATVHDTELLGDVVHPVPVAVLLLSIVFVPATAANDGTVVDHALHVVPPLVVYLYSSAMVPVPPLPAVIVTVRVCPAHNVARLGDFVIPGATGRATTVHDTELLGDVVHPVPVAVLLLSIVFVPVTAANDGTVVDHALHVVPPLVLYLYSSAIVPVPPLPAVIVTVSVCPAQTIASTGDLVRPGATGSATTVHDTELLGDVVQPVPVAVLLLSIVFVPVTAANDGTVVDHALHVVPPLVVYLYSSAIVPVPPLPAVIVTVSVWPEHTFATFGDLVRPGATGNATTVHETELLGDVVHPVPVAVLLLSIVFVPATAANDGTVVDQALHVVPPLVVYLYSSAIVPVPPLPAVIVTVSV